MASLRVRVFLAILLMGLYYVGALAMVGLLLFFSYSLFVEPESQPLVAIACLAVAWIIVREAIPRPAPFQVPGPKLNSEEHADLFALISDAAESAGQPPCATVYLDLDCNAGVAQSGGRMGLGGERVLTLGLPLLQGLSRRQLRGVLTHEFGHFSAGHNRLAPWVYLARNSLVRTIEYSRRRLWPFHWIFVLFTKLFLRLTQAVSRRQEQTADEIATRAMGSTTIIAMLKAVRGMSIAFATYWNDELSHPLDNGFRPPIAAGFRRFISVPRNQVAIREAVARSEVDLQTDPYDTHPSLSDRVKAAEDLAVEETAELPGDAEPAADLLEVEDYWERWLLDVHLPGASERMTPIAWEKVGEKVYLTAWENAVRENRVRLEGIRAADIPAMLDDPAVLVSRFARNDLENAPYEFKRSYAIDVLGAAIGLALVHRGWKPAGPPGEPLHLEKDGAEYNSFQRLSDVLAGAVPQSEWLNEVADLGIADLDLSLGVPTAIRPSGWSQTPEEITPSSGESELNPFVLMGALFLVFALARAISC